MTADNDRYVYIGPGSCGCVREIVIEMTESQYWRNETSRHVAEMIRGGLRVDCIPAAVLNGAVGRERTFLACPHVKNEVAP